MTPAARLRLVALILGVVGAASAVLLITTTYADGWGPVAVLVMIASLRSFDIFASYKLQPKELDATWQIGEALFIVAIVVLEPTGAIVATAGGLFVGFAAARVNIGKAIFNVGLDAAAVAVALSVFRTIAPGEGFSTETVLAGAVASLVYTTLTAFVVAAAICLLRGGSLRDNLPSGRLVYVQWVCSVSLGLMAAAASREVLWLPLLALPPVAMVQYVLVEHFRARRDRERLDGLFGAATEAHSSILTQEVEHALHRAAARLLRADIATVECRPPAGGELGVPLSTVDGTPRWLIVDSQQRGEAFDEEDVRLLEALAAIGSSALDNAHLVEEIRRQSIRDTVTGLANQALFEDRVAQAAAVAWRTRERFAVLMLDLDSFKRVNDSLGHSIGNQLLQLIGERLAGAVREVDTVARLGSDHFTILLPGIGTPQTAGVMAEKLLSVVRRSIELERQELFMTASAGIAFFPDDGTHAEHLLRNADSAMHRAKDTGKDGYQIYAAGMNEQAHLRLARESELHNGLARNELRVRYQPQIDLRTGRIVAVEALVRWEHPVLGLIGPHEFVPLAEESGLIVDLDGWVLREACRQAVAWTDEDLPPVRVAVNLSGRHFHATDRVVETVAEQLRSSGLDPQRLELEVTEHIAVGEADDAIDMLQRIRDLGVGIAIDDFGTGYSMLGRLQRFPVDRLKIDRTFVREIESAHGEAPIVAAMIAMARSLRLEVVAEGVETLEQQTFLRHHGCDMAQGFLFSHAVPPDEIARLLRTPSVGFNLTAVS